MGRYREAVVPLARAFAIAETGAREDASDADSRGQIATTGLVLADALRHLDSRRALSVYDRILSTLEKIPNNPRARLQEVRALAGSTLSVGAPRPFHRGPAAVGFRLRSAAAIETVSGRANRSGLRSRSGTVCPRGFRGGAGPDGARN